MSGNINKATVMGRLGADPEQRAFQGGGSVVKLNIATTEYWSDRDGQRRQAVEWHHVAIFNEALGKLAMKALRKGSAVYVEGKLATRCYTDDRATERKITEIILPKFKGELQLLDPRSDAPDPEADGKMRAAGDAAEPPPLDDEVPF